MNTKSFGNIGVGKAINYFVSRDYKVSIPINDSQKYDLIVDLNDKIYRVSVRSSRCISEYGIPRVHLRTTGGNQSFNYARPFDSNSCELLFAYIPGRGIWLIPTSDFANTNTISLGTKYSQYQVKIDD